MRTNGFRLPTVGALAGTLAMLAITLGTAAAQVPSTTDYFLSSHPMISGTVVSVNDHQMVVDTDQGQQVTLDLDSRTMAPRDFAPGMVMRAEFRAFEDCRLYAERIIPIRSGMSVRRTQAYANTREGGTVMAGGASMQGDDRRSWSDYLQSGDNEDRRAVASGDYSAGRMMNATHSTADFQYSNRPMISGRVVSITDHRMVVQTVQGHTIGIAMDSRTMLPREVGPDAFVRAQITTFGDGRHYAQRISRIDASVVDREQAYAHTRDADLMLASTPPDCESVSSANTSTSVAEPSREVERPEAVYAQNAPPAAVEEPAVVEAREESLPQTASTRPLILLLGLGALALAGLVTGARALRIV